MKKKLVLIGGGTGSFTLLSGLKKYPFDITALVNMADNGGSSGVLRDEMGVLPPGDVRQCLIALSDSPQILRDLFNYRFPKGTSFAGHSFGNLFLSAFEDMTGDFTKAVELAEQVLHINGRVLPITTDNCHLCIETSAGPIKGEHQISEISLQEGERPLVWLSPKANLSADASKAIIDADIIVIAPGDLYESLAPALLVEGMNSALAKSKATKVYVANLVNKPQKTKGFFIYDYVSELERFVGRPFIDKVVYNNQEFSEHVLSRYKKDHELPVAIESEELIKTSYKVVAANLLASDAPAVDKNDKLKDRSLIRHDPDKIADVINQIG